MKTLFRLLITALLNFRARKLLARYHTQVIAITGSVGKTSVKEAIYTILKDHFKVYRSSKGFNTDLGVALSILQEEESAFSSPWQWAKIMYRAFFGRKKHYQKMILEFGADHPGDIRRLTRLVRPTIGVITNVHPVHLESGQFKDVAAIAKEKHQLIKRMEASDIAILNYDDPLVRRMETAAQKVYYGTQGPAHLKVNRVRVGFQKIVFSATYKNEQAAFEVPVIGSFQLGVLLPAIAVGLQLGLTLNDCAKSLRRFRLPPGRMSLIPGREKSHLIDSSYNASPVTMKSALDLLKELPGKRKIAVLGTMNELGKMSDEAHTAVGAQAGRFADLLIAVGASAHLFKRGALAAGMKEANIFTFLDAEEAGYFARDILQSKDLLLIKGSQNRVRMERFTRLAMEHPEKADKLLCRQEPKWQEIS